MVTITAQFQLIHHVAIIVDHNKVTKIKKTYNATSIATEPLPSQFSKPEHPTRQKVLGLVR